MANSPLWRVDHATGKRTGSVARFCNVASVGNACQRSLWWHRRQPATEGPGVGRQEGAGSPFPVIRRETGNGNPLSLNPPPQLTARSP
jgi:hypothetical protein